MINSVTLLTIMFSYFSIFYFVTNGRTFGKMLLGLSVKSAHEEMTLNEAMIRSFSYFVCAMTGSFLFCLPFLRKDKRSLADILSKTNVVSDDEKVVVELKLLEHIEHHIEEDKAA
jgi:uncharacterized RDD family membrane protein YckC